MVLKDSNHNAFNSVGGMRDTFTKRVEPAELRGPQRVHANELDGPDEPALPFSDRFTSETSQANVQLEYQAPDIYPAGVKTGARSHASGDQNVVIEDTTITPKGVQPGTGVRPRELDVISAS